GDGTARRTRGQRVSGASLPDLDSHLMARDDLCELDVRAVRKCGVVLDLRPEGAYVDRRDVRDDDDAVRITDVHRGHVDPAAVDVDRGDLLVDQCLTHIHRNLRDAAALVLENTGNAPAQRVEREWLLRSVTVLTEKLCEDAHSIPALFCLGAVCIQDAHAEVRAGT